ncbi:MAG TPA: hypothetical protein VKX39_13395 [Bryobacteraceae bacterium]|nr:hypothetical protein [Bryobacteraceae bacterium]
MRTTKYRPVLFLLCVGGIPSPAQSLHCPGGAAAYTTLPASPADSQLNSYRWEGRFFGASWAAGYQDLLDAPTVGLQVLSSDGVNGTLYVAGEGYGFQIDITTLPSDWMWRLQRNQATNSFSFELWSADGSGYRVFKSPLTNPSVSFAGTISICGRVEYGVYNSANINAGFLRLYSDPTPPGSAPPHARAAPPGNLLDWEFQGTLADSSGNGFDLNWRGAQAVSFAIAPVYPPVASAGMFRVIRAGAPAALDGSGSFGFAGDGSVSYQWQQIAGPNQVVLTGANTATPVISGTVFGSYTFQLTVTDANGIASHSTVTIGSAPADVDGRVAISDPAISAIIGPLIMWGQNPWPWQDDRHKAFADYFGPRIPPDDWMNPLAGTIAVSNGSRTITGTGTTFRADFCAGGSTPSGQDQFVIWTSDGTNIPRKAPYGIASCDSDTSLTLNGAYSGASSNGLTYSKMANYGTWINGSSNVNYYDAVLAFYSLYYRTGLSQYQSYARTLADRWMSMPFIDYFRATGGAALVPREKAMAGLMIRYFDGQPAWMQAFERNCDAVSADVPGNVPPYDGREMHYDLWQVSLCAMYDPDPVKAAAYQAWINQSIAQSWLPQQIAQRTIWGAAGAWGSFGYNDCRTGWHAWTGTVSLINGSATVTWDGSGSPTNWTAADCFGTDANELNEQRWIRFDNDSRIYYPVFVSPTQLTLKQADGVTDAPYEGITRSGGSYDFSDTNTGNSGTPDGDAGPGPGVAPFLQGIVMTAWYYAYLATGNPQARQFVEDNADWLVNYGIRKPASGLYYARLAPHCEPIREGIPGCSADDVAGSRFLSLQTFGGLARAALLFPGRYDDAGELLYAAAYGAMGGPGTDANWATELQDDVALAESKWKDFGFAFGVGGGSCWPAARMITRQRR